MWPFKRKAWLPPTFTGSASFGDWTEDEINYVSEAIRHRNGQPDSAGFHTLARVALNTMRGGSAVELVARAMEESANPGMDPERPISIGHYQHGQPHWCMWVEYAAPAVATIIARIKKE